MKRNCHKLSPQMKWFTPCSIVDEVLAFSEQQYITCKQTTASTATRPIHLLEHPSLPFCFLMKTCIIHVSLILHISTQSLNTYLKHAVDIYQLEHDKVLKKSTADLQRVTYQKMAGRKRLILRSVDAALNRRNASSKLRYKRRG